MTPLLTASPRNGKPGYVKPGTCFVNGSPLQLALRELRARFSNPRTLGVLLVIVVALALTGPFGTFAALSPAARFGYWAAVTLATFALGLFFGMMALEAMRRFTPNRSVLTVSLALGACLPVTLAVSAVNILVLGEPLPGLSAFVELLLNCFFVTLGIAVLVMLTRARPALQPMAEAADIPDSAPLAPRQPAILQRLPLPQRGALQYLSMQDHYVDVVTDKGHALVLLRLSDAIAETGPVSGLQIHRSHWVALDAVRSVARSEGKVLLELRDGTRLPVSRSALPAVREAGLLP